MIDSIVKANDQGKIKIKKVVDNTAADVEIQIDLTPGISPDITIDALYKFTDCEVSIAPNACVIVDHKPQFLGVHELLRISISVFYNNQLLAFNRRLSTKAIHFSLGLDSTKEVNELTMFADNLGSLPPNTALMLVYDGKKRYEIRLSSNLQKNATVRIKRKKK